MFSILLVILTFLNIQELSASEISSQDSAFYAVSSIRSHLEELLSPDGETPICSESDIAALWEAAEVNSPSAIDKLMEAEAYYYEAQNTNNEALYLKAKSLLEMIWEDWHQQILYGSFSTNKEGLSAKYPSFKQNRNVTSEMRNRMKPFLLPEKNPLKTQLDAIFNAFRATENYETFSQAGFQTFSFRPSTYILVARHPSVPGHIFKVYLDSEARQKDKMPGWLWLTMRCEGARNVRQLIKKRKMKYFSVPDKWLYPLPIQPSPKSFAGPFPQPVILVVTDMNIVSDGESREAWKNVITPQHLDELYCILSHGYSSTYVAENIPYTKNGKFSCIDTEHPKRKLKYKSISRYLSTEMEQYWNKLVRKGGRA